MYGIDPTMDWSFFLGKRLESVGVGLYAIRLGFDGEVSVSITGSFQYGANAPVSAQNGLPDGAVPLLKLLGHSVSSASVVNARSLLLAFDDEQTLRLIDDNEGYESLEIYASGHDCIVI
jgi:hypothetical protein